MKLVRERQKSYDFTDMRTLRDKTDEHREGKQKQYKNREGNKTEETHKYREQIIGCQRWALDEMDERGQNVQTFSIK